MNAYDLPQTNQVLTAVTVKQASIHPWGQENWTLAGVIPGLTPAQLSHYKQQGTIHMWPELTLTVYAQHCEAYYQNLTAKQPIIALVCHQEDALLAPFLLTVDPDEAEAYMDSGAIVLTADLSEVHCLWLEQFVMTHYRPQEKRKRQRESWYNHEEKE